SLSCQGVGVVGGGTWRSVQCARTGQFPLGLRDKRLEPECINVIRRNIQDLIKLSQRFGKTTKADVRLRVPVEQVKVARVEPLGFVEVRLAPVPLASSPLQKRHRLKNQAAIRQELTCPVKVRHRSVVIPQAGVVVKSLGQYGLAEIGLKSERGFGCLPRLFAQGDRWWKKRCAVAGRIKP